MLTWTNRFEGMIIGRGKKLASEGAVGLHRASPGWEAMVVGTELYTVRVQLAGGQVTRLACNCPYAEHGKNCKHMAAVFLVLEKRAPEILTDDDAALAGRLGTLSSADEEDALQLAIDLNSTRCTALLLNHRAGEGAPRYAPEEFTLDDLPQDALRGEARDLQGDNDPMQLLFPGSGHRASGRL